MKTLYELVGEQLELYELLSESDCIDEDGVLDPVVAEQLKFTSQDIKQKAINYAIVIKQLRSEAESIKAEEQQLYQRRKRREKNADRLANILQDNLLLVGFKEKIVDAKVEIGFRRSEKIEVVDESVLPSDYFRIKREVDAAKLKKDIKAGAEIAGARLKECQNIQIK